ncbi:MAG: TlpA family protein disulfide reductase [Gammaproteobacteria bacterium]
MEHHMQRRPPGLRPVVAIALAGLALAAAAADGPSAPDFALRSSTGTNHRLSEHRGEVVALVFWASWCGACRRELERFEKLRRTYGSAGLVVFAVNLDKDPAQARSHAAAAGIGYPVLFDASKDVSRAYQADDLPLVVLVDRHGVVRSRHFALDEREARGLMVTLRDMIDE